jgi:hypothetical protein
MRRYFVWVFLGHYGFYALDRRYDFMFYFDCNIEYSYTVCVWLQYAHEPLSRKGKQKDITIINTVFVYISSRYLLIT